MYGKLCTKFYDLDKKFASDEEVSFYKNFFNSNDLILEPMCGSGRLLIPLIKSGLTVHGIDNSKDMLDSCKKRSHEIGITPLLFEQPIENMQVSNQYDDIIIPFGSFQLLHPRGLAFQVLEIFKKHLKPGGRLILDLFIPWDALYEKNQEKHSEREVRGDNGLIIKASSHNVANKFEQFIISKTIYTELISEKITRKEEEQIYICWYYRYEMELILEKYGFKKIQYLERFLNNSDHMTIVAENI